MEKKRQSSGVKMRGELMRPEEEEKGVGGCDVIMLELKIPASTRKALVWEKSSSVDAMRLVEFSPIPPVRRKARFGMNKS